MSWQRCSACKRDIEFGAVHWVCSVSTCNRRATDYKFCTVACWDSHVATFRHRDAWAVEARAPSRGEAQRAADAPRAPSPSPSPASASGGGGGATSRPAAPAPVVRPTPSASGDGVRRMVAAPAAAPAASGPELAPAEREILIVVSKLKKYIRERSGMNTSDAVADALSENVRALCDDAIRAAGADGRKTVLDRDVPRPRR